MDLAPFLQLLNQFVHYLLDFLALVEQVSAALPRVPTDHHDGLQTVKLRPKLFRQEFD